MDKANLIPIGEHFMVLNEVIKHFCPPDSSEIQQARWHLKMAYAYIRRAFGCPEDRKSEA